MKIPSEPIRKERICQNLTEAFGEELGFSIYYCKADPPLKKKIGGDPRLLLSIQHYTGSKAWGTPFNCYSRSLAKSIARTPPSNPEQQGIKMHKHFWIQTRSEHSDQYALQKIIEQPARLEWCYLLVWVDGNKWFVDVRWPVLHSPVLHAF